MNNNLLSEAIKSPCNECHWHLAGNSKMCERCAECQKRIDYDNFISDSLPSYAMDIELGRPITATQLAERRREPVPFSGIDWGAVEAEYIKSVVEKKKTMAELAQQFGMHIKTLYRYRDKDNWPKIKIFECNEKKCRNPAEIKGKCKKCYQRIWMREKKKAEDRL